jgi:DNA-binding transcriptional ArsR family regulator
MDTLKERISPEKLQKAAEMLRTAAHPQRLAILEVLGGETQYSVSELQNLLQIEQAILSQHLTLLRDKGLVDFRKEGKSSYYFLKHPDFLNIINCLENCCAKL